MGRCLREHPGRLRLAELRLAVLPGGDDGARRLRHPPRRAPPDRTRPGRPGLDAPGHGRRRAAAAGRLRGTAGVDEAHRRGPARPAHRAGLARPGPLPARPGRDGRGLPDRAHGGRRRRPARGLRDRGRGHGAECADGLHLTDGPPRRTRGPRRGPVGDRDRVPHHGLGRRLVRTDPGSGRPGGHRPLRAVAVHRRAADGARSARHRSGGVDPDGAHTRGGRGRRRAGDGGVLRAQPRRYRAGSPIAAPRWRARSCRSWPWAHRCTRSRASWAASSPASSSARLPSEAASALSGPRTGPGAASQWTPPGSSRGAAGPCAPRGSPPF